MVTTEEKITYVERVIENAKKADAIELIDCGDKCLKELHEQLKQETVNA